MDGSFEHIKQRLKRGEHVFRVSYRVFEPTLNRSFWYTYGSFVEDYDDALRAVRQFFKLGANRVKVSELALNASGKLQTLSTETLEPGSVRLFEVVRDA